MKNYPIYVDGQEADVEDIAAGALAAGQADDAAHVRDTKIFIEGTSRKAWIVPWHEGPLVVGNGASGTLKVRPFTIYMSPAGATSNAGTEDASGGGEDITSIKSAVYLGGTVPVPVPLPTVGNARWDRLYAIITELDTAPAARLVRDPVTKVNGTQTINTRHGSQVTLAFIQGVAASAANPYPLADFPDVLTPDVGAAHASVAAIRVNYSATPATVTYGADDIANEPRLSRPNPQEGGMCAGGGSLAGLLTVGATSLPTDIKTLATTPVTEGGWPLAGTNVRPASFIEKLSGIHARAFHLGPFSTTVAATTFVAGWRVLSDPLFTPDIANQPLRDDAPRDWRNRWFFCALAWGRGTAKSAHDLSGSAATAWTPTGYSDKVQWSTGQSFRAVNNFDTETGFAANLYAPIAIWRDVGGAVANDDIALLVNRTTGAIHVAAREATAGVVNGHTGVALAILLPEVGLDYAL